MGNVKRIYVEKKDSFAVKARELEEDIKGYLGISGLEKVRIFIRYDVENISDEILCGHIGNFGEIDCNGEIRAFACYKVLSDFIGVYSALLFFYRAVGIEGEDAEGYAVDPRSFPGQPKQRPMGYVHTVKEAEGDYRSSFQRQLPTFI